MCLQCCSKFNGRRLYAGLRLDYRLGLYCHTLAMPWLFVCVSCRCGPLWAEWSPRCLLDACRSHSTDVGFLRCVWQRSEDQAAWSDDNDCFLARDTFVRTNRRTIAMMFVHLERACIVIIRCMLARI